MTWSDVLVDFQATQSAAQSVGWANVVADAQKGISDVQVLLGAPIYDPRLVNLAPNNWVDLGPFNPTVVPGETLAETRNWGNSGFVWDKKRSRIVGVAGGHSGTNDNTVFSVSALDGIYREDYPPMPANHVLNGSTAANQPDMVYANYDTPPTVVRNPDGSIKATIANDGRGCFLAGPPGTGPYPRPATRHSGQQIVVTGDEIILFGHVEGNGPNTQQGINDNFAGNPYVFNCNGQAAHYAFGMSNWDFENATPTNTDNDGLGQFGAFLPDPISGLVVRVAEKGFGLYDPVARTTQRFPWTIGKLKNEAGANVLFSNPPYTLSLVRDPVHDVFYCLSLHDDVWRVNYDRANPSAVSMTLLTMAGNSPYQDGAHPQASEHSHRWDTVNSVVGVGPFNSVFYFADVVAQTWSKITIPVPVGSQFGNSHLMDYCDGPNVYIWLTDQNNVPQMLKYHWIAYKPPVLR